VEAWARSHPEGVSVLRVPASWAVAGEGVIGVVRGFNYNGGGWERVAVLRSKRAAAEAGQLLAARRERGAGGGGG
jgi:hypothetical protein